MAKIRILKAHQGPTGFVQAGAEVEMDVHRQRALARSGIVAAPDHDAAHAPAAPREPGAITSQSFAPRREKITEPVKSAEPVKPAAAAKKDQ